MNDNQISIMNYLLAGNRIVGMGKHSWKWNPRTIGAPSLSNRYVAPLIASCSLEYKDKNSKGGDDELILSSWGKVVMKNWSSV